MKTIMKVPFKRKKFPNNKYFFDGDIVILLIKTLKRGIWKVLFHKRHYSRVCKHSWRITEGYVYNNTVGKFHTFILNVEIPKGHVCDHINGDPFNNLDTNLRIVTNKKNLQNQKYKYGYAKYNGGYAATLIHNGKLHRGPKRKTTMEAINDRKDLEIKYRGELIIRDNPCNKQSWNDRMLV